MLNHASPTKNNIKGSKSEPGQAEIEKALLVEKSQELAQAVSNQSISSTASTPTATSSGMDRTHTTTRKGNRKFGSTQERIKSWKFRILFGVSLSAVLGVVLSAVLGELPVHGVVIGIVLDVLLDVVQLVNLTNNFDTDLSVT